MGKSLIAKRRHSRKSLHMLTRSLAATAMGIEPADLIIRGGDLVNVNTASIQKNIDISVRHGYIAHVGDSSHILQNERTQVLVAHGHYLLPGFIDSHAHIESAMVDLPNFASAVLPHGTTTIACNIHALVNVFGLKAVELYYQSSLNLPLKVLIAMPVCIPSNPELEDAGASIGPDDIASAYNHGWAQLQGEQLNFNRIIHGDLAAHAILAESHKANVVQTGRYASQDLEMGLQASIAAGINSCQQVFSTVDVIRRMELGCYVQQRSPHSRLDPIQTIDIMAGRPDLDTRFFTLVTDDLTPLTVVNEGHMDREVRRAIARGVQPVTAIQMATLNPAQLLEKSRRIGTISPGRAADILLVRDLSDMIVNKVFADGVLVAEDGQMVVEIAPYAYPDWSINSIHLDPLSIEDFRIPGCGSINTVRVIRIAPEVEYTKEDVADIKVVDHQLPADPKNDLAKAVIFYRHTTNESLVGKKGMGFVSGLKLKPNVAYASTICYDSHNLLVVGTSDRAMCQAANELIRIGGGICVVIEGKIDSVLPLPLGGVITPTPASAAAKGIEAIGDSLIKAGCPYDSFEMPINMLGLVGLHHLHLSNRGLVKKQPGQEPQLVDLIRSITE